MNIVETVCLWPPPGSTQTSRAEAMPGSDGHGARRLLPARGMDGLFAFEALDEARAAVAGLCVSAGDYLCPREPTE